MPVENLISYQIALEIVSEINKLPHDILSNVYLQNLLNFLISNGSNLPREFLADLLAVTTLFRQMIQRTQ